MEPFSDEYFMKAAYQQALIAEGEGEIPVGAVIVAGNQIIGKGYNQTETLKDSTAHAEMIALTSAFQYLGSKYLNECRIYVTLEPCMMCGGALHWAQIDELVYGANDPRKGYSLFKMDEGQSLLHPRTSVRSGIMETECREIVEHFFKRIREQ